MPLIPYPSATRQKIGTTGAANRITEYPPIDGTTLALANPSRITHISPATDDQITIDRAPSRWRLGITFGEMITGSPIAQAFETFLARLEDSDNYADFPLGLRAPSWTGTSTITATAVNAITVASLPAGIADGDFVRVGGRLAKAESVAAALRQITLLPRPLGAVGDSFGPGTHWRGRMAGAAQYSVPTRNGMIGSVTLDLIEVI